MGSVFWVSIEKVRRNKVSKLYPTALQHKLVQKEIQRSEEFKIIRAQIVVCVYGNRRANADQTSLRHHKYINKKIWSS